MVIGYARRQQMFFYEIHEGDEELGTAVLLAHEQHLEPLEFFALVKKARTLLVDSFEEDSLSEAIANELARTAGFIHVTDDLLVASVNVDVTEEGTFLVSEEAGDGSASGARPELLAIDMSTISPAASREIAKRAAANKPPFHTLDAPVSGGELGAIEARLAIMVGGGEADTKRAMPLFEVLGKTIVHIGDHGAGQACKLANQIAVAINTLGVSEALVFAKAQGIDLERTRQVIAGGAGSSWAMQNYAPKMLAGDFRPGFMVDLQQKDLRLVLDNAFVDHEIGRAHV